MYKTTAATLACCLLTASSGGELRSEVTKDQKITRSFSVMTEMALDEMSVTVEGEEMGGMGDDFEHEMTTELTIEVTDVILAAKDGKAQKLSRTFDTLEMTSGNKMAGPMGDQDDEIDFASELEGATVVFTEGEDGFEAGYPEGEESDSELLEGLDALLNYAELLPEGEVAEGDTWELPVELYKLVAEPGGNLHFEPEVEEEGLPDFGEEPEPEVDGKIEATYKGTKTIDDVEYAVIALAAEVTMVTDRTDFFNSMRADAPDDPEMMLPEVGSATEEIAFEGEGEVLWNLAAGRMHTLEISGEVERIEVLELTMSMGDMQQTMEQSSTMIGTETYSVRFDG